MGRGSQRPHRSPVQAGPGPAFGRDDTAAVAADASISPAAVLAEIAQSPGGLAEVEELIELLAGRWEIPVIGALADGPRSHRQLLASLGEGVTDEQLAATIGRLQSHGIVLSSTAGGGRYTLTAAGHSLLEPLAAMGRWYRQNAHRIPRRRS
jgi:DNA-binding HxlR family transcriptional regulator